MRLPYGARIVLPADVADARRRPSCATGSVAGAVFSSLVLGSPGQLGKAASPPPTPARLGRGPIGGLEGQAIGLGF